MAEIRDPIHGYVFANELERSIIDTSVFQRLRRIRQLAGCHLVYPGGQHSRFEHVIGAMYLAGKVGDILESRRVGFTSEDTQKLRLAALLHDVGHGPFSHMFEEVLSQKTETSHEEMTQKIIAETEIGDILESSGFSKKEMCRLAVGESIPKKKMYMNEVISGSLSVDLMDYLLRDSYFTGVEYGNVDVTRIINSFEVVRDRLAISQAALFAFEALMIARYQMFRAVYFHRTVRAAELMIIRAMILSDKVLHLTDLSLENYLSLTDDVTLYRIANLEDNYSDPEISIAKGLANGYMKRELLKCVYEKTVQRKDRFLASIFNAKGFREQFQNRIAEKAGVSPEEVYLDVPTAPSIPISSSKESFSGITLVDHRSSHSASYYTIKMEDLPLIGTIAGYLDVVRVYTSQSNRPKVEEAAAKVFGKENFEDRNNRL